MGMSRARPLSDEHYEKDVILEEERVINSRLIPIYMAVRQTRGVVLLWEDGEQVRRPTSQKLYQYPMRNARAGRDTQGGQKKGRRAHT